MTVTYVFVYASFFSSLAFMLNSCNVEKPAETKTRSMLDSSLVREPNLGSGGHELESPVWNNSAH
jgi:hypothetical protein